MKTRSRRKVPATKTKKLESQERQEQLKAKKKADDKAKREAAEVRKQARLMKPREEEVSQLADHLGLLSSSL